MRIETPAGRRHERVAGGEVPERDLGGKDLGGNGEERRAHEASDRRLGRSRFRPLVPRPLVPRPHPKGVPRTVREGEEGKADDVVDMAVGEEEIEVRAAFLGKPPPEGRKPGPRVEHQHRVAAADLDARGVAAIAGEAGVRDRDASAHPPESGIHLVTGAVHR